MKANGNLKVGSIVGVLAVLLALSGCGVDGNDGGNNGAGTAAVSAARPFFVNGAVHGGQQPIVGAVLQMYETGMTGYTGLAKPLLTQTVISGAGGSFSITGDYSCDTGSYVYITAAGGNPGTGVSNPNIALMSALGSCSTLLANAATTFIVINEVTTVAGAYALAQYSGGTRFGTSLYSRPGSSITPAYRSTVTSDLSGGVDVPIGAAPADNFTTTNVDTPEGMANAMDLAQVIANTASGTSPGNDTNATATVNSMLVNAIANMLAACVNSGGSSDPTNAACTTLYNNVIVPAGTNPLTGGAYPAPADTLQAAVYMALNPNISASHTSTLYGLINGAAPFQPYTTSASAIPNFTISPTLFAQSAFASNTISPFSVCTYESPNYGALISASPQTWWTPSASLGQHYPAWNQNPPNNLALQFWWTQTGYDGTRDRRGVEACGPLAIATEGWYGFSFYPPSGAGGGASYPNNKLGAIAQIFQDGYCNSWAALLIVQNGALELNWRDYCGTANVIPLANSIQYDQWNPIIIHWVNSNNGTGQIQVWYGSAVETPSNPTYSVTNINFGFAHDWATGGPLPVGSTQGLKIGMYNFDDGNYTPGEVRTIYYNNVTQFNGYASDGWWRVNPLY
jgi:hypothetical protein